ncbi:facilitated trehalose transporter Tret1-like [Aricia agestis]|uniref:facilitated trehalose transporter Tret1-like n=1 Tax=Aricia agestis TaxID=91739 RepID=UPI001C202CD0|nr:facilitated trehalose transporter Tret1-like [Aricia agestis]
MAIVQQAICTFIVCLLSTSAGFIYSWPSSTITMFSSTNTTLNRPMTVTEQTMFASVFAIVALIMTPATGYLLDKIGRKNTCILFALPQIISWVIISSSRSVELVLTAMCISGVGGCILTCVPMYISEICQETIRGTMLAGVNLFYGIGITLSYVFGGCLSYQTMNYTCLSISAASIILMTYMRESPLYLLKKGLDEEAAKSVAFYRSVKVDSKVVVEEIETIRRTLNSLTAGEQLPEEESLKPPKTPEKRSILQIIRKSKSSRQGIIVVLAVTLLSMFQGVAGVQVYAQPLFEKAMPSVSGNLMSVVFGLLNITSGFIAAFLVDIYGRRRLMICSSALSGITCLAVATQVHMQWGPDWLTVVFIYIYCIVYTFGGGTVPYIIMAEFFLPEVKSFMVMVCTEWAWICNFLVVFTLSIFVTNFGIASAFYLFSVFCILSVVYCYYYLPETKALTVDVIQTLLIKKRQNI